MKNYSPNIALPVLPAHWWVAVLLALSCAVVWAQCTSKPGSPAATETRSAIESLNRQIETAYRTKNAAALAAFYDKTVTYIPEYEPVLYGAADIKAFFTNWFHAADIKSYEKSIYEIVPIGSDYILESGTFVLDYATEQIYKGKYMIIWKRQPASSWKILAEAFGADTQVKSQDMPYASVTVPEKDPLDSTQVRPAFAPILDAFNKGVVRAVLEGDGEARAAEFCEDGIYMPHFDPMQIGMAKIRPYMLKTYKPNVFTYNTNTFREIFAAGDYAFLSGHFKVGSHRPGNDWGFEGNMCNLMKKCADGQWRIFRQLAHN